MQLVIPVELATVPGEHTEQNVLAFLEAKVPAKEIEVKLLLTFLDEVRERP